MNDSPTSSRADRDRDNEAPLEWAVRSGATAEVIDELERTLQARRRRRMRLAAVAAMALVAGLVWWRVAPGEQVRVAQAAVVVSLPERQTLSDGTVVELRPGARVAVEFSPARRKVALLGGEAHFQVAKDAGRPFVVAAGGVEFRAVGTAFSVQLASRGVELLVTEGKVAVDDPQRSVGGTTDATARPSGGGPGETAQTMALVAAGNRFTMQMDESRRETAPQVSAVPAAEMDKRLAWRAPQLEFSSTPLSDALPMINRYSRVRLVLGDTALGRVRLSGIVRGDNVDLLLDVLANDYGIRAERNGPSEVILRAAQ